MGALHHRNKRLPGRSILRMISCLHIWTLLFSLLFQRKKNILRSWFSDGDNIFTHISIPGTGNSTALILVGDGAGCRSIIFCWNFLDLRFILIGIVVVFKICINPGYRENIVIHIIKTDGVLCLNWSNKGWRDKPRSPMNNSASSVNVPPPLYFFHWKFFLKGKIQSQYWKCRSSLPWYPLYRLFTILRVLTFVCSCVASLRPSGT